MSKFSKYAALAVFVGAGVSTAAFADTAETKGGIKIKTEDGRFEGTLGGRIHYDYSAIQEDTVVGSTDGAFLRRAYVTLAGKLYGFKYKVETDLKGSAPETKDVWLGTDLLGGFIKGGHMQQAYGMEALTSSNELLFTERPFISNNTIYSGREFQNGVSYDTNMSGFTFMGTIYDATPASTGDGSKVGGGRGYSARATYAPLAAEGSVLHLGLSYDDASYKTGTGPAVKAAYVGKQGPTSTLVAAGYEEQQTVVGELAGALGSAFVQGEYAQAKYKQPAAADVKLDSYYVQGSFFVTGEEKVYKAGSGVFGNPKPKNDFGAVELKARYDVVKNKNTDVQAKTASVGANYYVNPNVRFMLDYNVGKLDAGATQDKPKAVVARAQLSF